MRKNSLEMCSAFEFGEEREGGQEGSASVDARVAGNIFLFSAWTHRWQGEIFIFFTWHEITLKRNK